MGTSQRRRAAGKSDAPPALPDSWPARSIEQRRVSDLVPYARNARTHSADQVAKIARSIEQWGWTIPVLIDERGGVIAGHGRLLAAEKLGIETVPTIVARGWTDAQRRAYALADNQIPLGAGWNPELLRLEIGELEALGFELPLLGFEKKELRAIRPMETAAGVDPDALPDSLPTSATTRPGDLWNMGAHKLLCGDARSEADIARVITVPVPLMLTDPPYCSGGFQEAGKSAGTWGEIASDNLSTRGYQALMRAVLAAAHPQAAYVFTDWRMWIPLFDLVESGGIPIRSMIVWNKGTPGLGSFWRTQHELVMFATRVSAKRRKGDPAVGNVIDCGRSGNANHYTEKPTQLLCTLLENDAKAETRDGSTVVFDPFVGSGSTIIAAEKLERSCAGMEIEPKIVDVAVLRWQQLTGREARLDGDGRTFLELAAVRAAEEGRDPESAPRARRKKSGKR